MAAPLLGAMASTFSHSNLGTLGGAALGSAHLPPQALPQLISPYVYGPIFGYDDPHLGLSGIWGAVGGYLTVLMLVLALLGLSGPGRHGVRVLLGVIVTLVFCRIYGAVPGLSGLLGLLPDMSRVAFFRYGTPVLELSVTILAALGLDGILRGTVNRRRVVLAAGAGLGLVLAAALEAHTVTRELGTKFAHRPYFAGSLAWAAVSLFGLTAGALLRGRRRAAVLAGLVALEAVAMFAVPEASAPRSVKLDLAPVHYLQRHLGLKRFFTLGPLQPNYGSMFALRELNVNDFPPSVFTG